MTICPIAIVASCKQCPVVSVCPLKSVIGDFPKSDEAAPDKGRAKAPGKGKSKK